MKMYQLKNIYIPCQRLKVESGVGTPGSGNSNKSTPKKHSLVSYQDQDAGLSDEDRESGHHHID